MTRWVFVLSLLVPGLYILITVAYYAGTILVAPGENMRTYDEIFAYTIWLPGSAAIGSWILGIVDAARLRRWGWLAVVLWVPVLGSLIYSIMARNQPQREFTHAGVSSDNP